MTAENTATPAANGPLAGVTVVTLEHAIAAPFATRQLADLGARVIKIERPGVGDFARAYDDRVRGLASHFVWCNRSKESLTLDVKRPEAREILARLVAKADVLVQNLAPGAAARLGLSEEALRPGHPRLIVCDISGYGGAGPYRDKKAYDLLIQSEAGLLSVTGTPDEPVKVGLSIADIAAGMYAYTGILGRAAPARAHRAGAAASRSRCWRRSASGWASRSTTPSRARPPPPRTGAFHATIFPYGPFPAGDGGTVMLGLQNEREWVVFCREVLGEPGLAGDERFASNVRRVANRDALTAVIVAGFARLTAPEVVARLDAAGIANAAVNDMRALWAHPQLAARGRWREVGTPAGPVPALLPPAGSDAFEAAMGPVPALGEHRRAILGELGYGADAIAGLVESGAV
jgi:itaconate CoA-transferase